MRFAAIALAVVSVVPACADSRFQIAIVPRTSLPAGRGECDIRVEIDNDVKITIRRGEVAVHNVSGEDARDNGSDCNVPLPAAYVRHFAVQPVDARSEIHVVERPSARNDYAVVLHIVDAAAGFGRYHFRLSWDADDRTASDHPDSPEGFAWNNAITYKGRGAGESVLNDGAAQMLGEVRVDIDLGGKIMVSFTPEPRHSHGARPVVFTGSVTARQSGSIRANMMTDDRRLSGAMSLSVDQKNNVDTIALSATNGQDRLTLHWDRR